jgi:hypothetical protein
MLGEAADAAVLARRIAAMGPTQAVTKLGADGAVALVDGELYRQQAVPVDVMDTVRPGTLSSPAIWPSSCPASDLRSGSGQRSALEPSHVWSPVTGKASLAVAN